MIQLLKLLRSIDLFSKPVSLTIKTQERHKTYFGALLTIIILSMITTLFIINFTNLTPRSYQYQNYVPLRNKTLQYNMQIHFKDQNITQDLNYNQSIIINSNDLLTIIDIQLQYNNTIDILIDIPTYYYDLKDINQPIKQRIERIQTTLQQQKTIDITLQQLTVITDNGLVFKDDHQQTVLIYSQHHELYEFNQQQILKIRIKLDSNEIVQYRSYPKLQQILGETGGLWNVFFTLALFLQLPFSILSYKLQLINSLFNFSDDDLKDQVIEQQQNQPEPIKDIPLCKSEANLPVLKKQKSWNQLNQLNIKKRLYSIQRKSQMMTEADTENQKAHLSNEISQSIKRFFRVVKKKLRLNLIEYLSFLFPNKSQKYQQYEFAINRMSKSIDILYIINKLHEIDKLKSLILNKSQIKMFDYLPKPFIAANPQTTDDHLCSLLRIQKTPLQKALEAQQAFKEIIKNINDPINQRLINFIDEPIIDLMKLQIDEHSIQIVQSEEIKLDTERQ